MAAPNIADVTLASVDPALLLCCGEEVKQGKDCSLILKYQGGKITTTLEVSKRHKAMAHKLKPVPLSSFQAEIWKNYSLIINDFLMKKGLPPSRLMLQQSKQSNEQFKCDQFDFKATNLDHLQRITRKLSMRLKTF